MASSKSKGRVSLDERFYLSADGFFLANAGLGLGLTKLPDSIRVTPADSRREMNSSFWGTVRFAGSFCSPSRGPTSTIWMCLVMASHVAQPSRSCKARGLTCGWAWGSALRMQSFLPPLSGSAQDETRELRPKFDADGLIAAIAQDAETGEVLMLAWMNAEALQQTIDTGRAVYWSRSRKSLWRKGDTSGHEQHIAEIRVDCDQDALLLRVTPAGSSRPATDRTPCRIAGNVMPL